MTLAAVDRLVHRATIFELNVESRCSGRYPPAARQPFASAITPSRPAPISPFYRDPDGGSRAAASRAHHARLWHRPGRCDPDFLTLIVAWFSS